MRTTRFAAALLVAALPAQDQPQGFAVAPAAELARLQPLFGTWQGRGKVRPAAGAEPAAWTATSTYRPALGGHFVEERATIAMPQGTIVLWNFLGFDRHTARWRALGVNNLGAVRVEEFRWLDERTMYSAHAGRDASGSYVERAITAVDGDTLEFRVERAVGAGAFFVHVEGRLERSAPSPSPSPAAAAGAGPAFVPPAPQIDRFRPWVGRFRVEGAMTPAPGMPPIPVTGTDDYRFVMGGTVLHYHTRGDAFADGFEYEAHSFYAWDPFAAEYVFGHVDNMGDIMAARGEWIGAAFVVTSTMRQNGRTMQARTTTECDDGAPARLWTEVLLGDAPPFRSFELTGARASK